MPEHPLHVVEHIIRNFGFAEPGTYELYIRSGHLRVRKIPKKPDGYYQVCKLSAREMNEGLDSPKWNQIEGRMRKLKQENKLCFKLSETSAKTKSSSCSTSSKTVTPQPDKD